MHQMQHHAWLLQRSIVNINQSDLVYFEVHDMQTLLIDGHNLFIRCYSSFSSVDVNGEPFGAVVGFLRSLCSFVDLTQATQVVVVFDGEGGSRRRRKLNPDYKGGSKPMRLNRMIEQSPDQEKRSRVRQALRLREYLSDLPVSVVEVKDIEADDAIAFLTQWFPGKKVIASNDNDFLQLLSDDVRIYKPTKHCFYTSDDCLKEHGVLPCNMALARSIAGDSSDCIKGIKGVGLKRLVKMVPEFGGKQISLQDLFTLCEQHENVKLLENKDIILSNYSLMSLATPLISGHSITSIKSSIKPYPTIASTALKLKLIRDAIDVGSNFHHTFLQLAYKIKQQKANDEHR